MLYLCALFSVGGGKTLYPARCFRSDLSSGDTIIIKNMETWLPAKFQRYLYGYGTSYPEVHCKPDELILVKGKPSLPSGRPARIGLSDSQSLVDYLVKVGWQVLGRDVSMSRGFKLTATNKEKSSNIIISESAIELGILMEKRITEASRKNTTWVEPYKINVKHSAYLNTFNLLEGIGRYAKDFLNNCADLSKYFDTPVVAGKSEDLKIASYHERRSLVRDYRSQNRNPTSSFDRELYSTLGGEGGRVYVSDGLYLSENGTWTDEGR